MDWKLIVKRVAPFIGAAIGGPFAPLASAAVSVLVSALGGDPAQTTDDHLAALVTAATPEQLLALKTQEANFAAQMQALGFQHDTDLAQADVQDRNSARTRQEVLKDHTPQILAYMGLAAWSGFNGILLFMAFRGRSLPADMSPIIMRVLGTMDALLGMAFSYFFGRSHDSAAKDQMLFNSTPINQAQQATNKEA